jgi:DnaJ-class molecular chaperone
MTPAHKTQDCYRTGYKFCSYCEGLGEFATGAIESDTGYATTVDCDKCHGEGVVIDEDAVCESCLERGKVVEYDVRLADGTQLCYDCADSNNPKVNEQ